MSVVVVDTNAAIMHGSAFSEHVRQAVTAGTTVIMPQSVKRELVDDVLGDRPRAR
jgi:rRNA-processing protein FCF1